MARAVGGHSDPRGLDGQPSQLPGCWGAARPGTVHTPPPTTMPPLSWVPLSPIGVAEQFAITEATLSAWSSLDDEELHPEDIPQDMVQLQGTAWVGVPGRGGWSRAAL